MKISKEIDKIHEMIDNEIIFGINNQNCACYHYHGCVWALVPGEAPHKGFQRCFPYSYKEVLDEKFDELHPF